MVWAESVSGLCVCPNFEQYSMFHIFLSDNGGIEPAAKAIKSTTDFFFFFRAALGEGHN